MLLLTSKKISMGRKIDISKSVTNWEWSNKPRLLVWKTLGAWWQEKEWAFCSRCLVNLSSALSVWVWCEKDLSLILPAFFCFYLLFYIIGKQLSYFLYLQCRTYAKVPIHMEWEKKKSHQVGISLLWHTHTHTHTHFQVCSSMLVLQIMPALLWHNRHNCAKKIIKHNNSIKNNLYEIVPFAELKGHYLISIGRIERPLFHNPLMLYLYFTVFVNLTGAYVRNIFNL